MSKRPLVAIAAALVGGALLAAFAPFAAVVAPISLLVVDLAIVHGEADLPAWPLRSAVRLGQTAIVLFALLASIRLGAGSPARAPWVLTPLAILVAFASLHGAAWSAGAVGGVGTRRPRIFLVEGALVALLDVALAVWATRLGFAMAAAPMERRWPALVAIAAALLARGAIVTTLSHRARTTPGTPSLAAFAFVAWLAAAATFATLRGTPLAWSGLGAALVLSLAAAWTQARTHAPSASLALARATLACMAAAYLAMLAAISGAA